MCLNHMRKITLNDSHRFDDIADTHCDAIKLALIDQIIPKTYINQDNLANDVITGKLMLNANRFLRARGARYGGLQ